MMKRKTIIVALIILLIGVITGIAAAVYFTSFTETVAVDYGEVNYTSSELDVVDYQTNGPGINTDSVDVTVNNTNQDDNINADVTVYLMDGETTVAEGTVTNDFTAGMEETVTVTFDDKYRENEYNSIDIKIEET